MPIPIGLSTAAVFPDDLRVACRMAADAGYDGVEVMVHAAPESQDVATLRRVLADHGLVALSVHAPCLLISLSVWTTDPLVKLARSVELAETLGAPTVVTHPPFVWQRAAAARFADTVAELDERVVVAVENMFPTRVRRQLINGYRPHWDPVSAGHRHLTLDLSHTATAGVDALDMRERMGSRLAHLHLADGSGSRRDEHLVPGRGTQPCAEVLSGLSTSGFRGAVIVEISTKTVSPDQRARDLAESLTFARTHLV